MADDVDIAVGWYKGTTDRYANLYCARRGGTLLWIVKWLRAGSRGA